MIVIAEFYARYRSTVTRSELTVAGENLLKFAENAAREYYTERYDQLGIAITMRVEIGSTRVWIIVKALGKAFLLYAAIRQGTDYLIQDSQNLARLVIPRIPAALKIPPQRPEYHSRRGSCIGCLKKCSAENCLLMKQQTARFSCFNRTRKIWFGKFQL
jgi:hypothetical protein